MSDAPRFRRKAEGYDVQYAPCGPHVSPEDIWVFMVSQVRYSLGRSSYIVSYTSELYAKYREYLKPEQRAQIRREIDAELLMADQQGRTVGMAQDHDTWKKLSARIALEEKSL